MKSVNPFTGHTIREIMDWNEHELESNLKSSERAKKAWKNTPIDDRTTFVRSIGGVLTSRRNEIAATITEEMGKTIAEALMEVDKCATVCEWYADNGPDYIQDKTVETDAKVSFISYEPVGTVLGIMPWNYPLWQVIRFVAPALVIGNTVLLKHASNVQGVANMIQSIMLESGIPRGVFINLRVPSSAMASIISDHRVNYVTLTGSEFAGSKVAAAAGRNLKKSVMELGGSDPFIVLESANIDEAVKYAVIARYQNAGQVCIAAKRFIIVDAVREEFNSKFVKAVGKLKYGDPTDPSTTLAPMVSEKARDEVQGMVDDLIKSGCAVSIGGNSIGYAGMEATIIDEVDPDFQEEIFGPVALIIRAKDEDEAIAIANNSRYGLSSSLWCEGVHKAFILAKRIEAGAVFVNTISRSDPRLPFGGTKLSGYGREMGEAGMHEMCSIKTVYIK